MKARLYAIPASHPAFATELMLQRKGIEYSRVDLPQWFHRGLLRVLSDLPEGVVTHTRNARRERLMAMRSLLDALIDDSEREPRSRRRAQEIEVE